jgi:ketosteroid isomerase-like protein
MKLSRILTAAAVSVLVLGSGLPGDRAFGQDKGQDKGQARDVAQVHAASQVFIAAIMARDIEAMDKVWAHEPYASFIGPLSTTVVVGWEGVRKAWQMRFSQFDRVTISVAESHVHTNGKVAWATGMEKVQLLRKDGKTVDLDAFVTNIFEDRGGRWFLVSHQATPMFKEPR